MIDQTREWLLCLELGLVVAGVFLACWAVGAALLGYLVGTVLKTAWRED